MTGKLSMLVLASTLQVGGGEMVLSRLLSNAAVLDVTPTLLLLKDPGPMGEQLAVGGVEVTSLDLENTRHPGILLTLLKTLRDLEPDLLYIQDHHDCLFWGRLAAAITGFRSALSPVHSSAQGDLIAFTWFNKLLHGLSPNLCTLGPWQGRALLERERVPPGFWVQIPNPVELTEVPPQVRSRGDHPLVLGTVAALRPEKRHDKMLELVANLPPDLGVELRIVGDGPLRGSLESLSRRLGIQERVRFLGQRENVARELAELDLFLLTSDEEALPVSVLEAIGAGVPVAAPPHGAIPELLGDGTRGLLFKGADPLDWSRQLVAYLGELPTGSQLEQWGAMIRERYSVANFLSDYGRIIHYLGGI